MPEKKVWSAQWSVTLEMIEIEKIQAKQETTRPRDDGGRIYERSRANHDALHSFVPYLSRRNIRGL